jgi:4-hydroxy-tetrahydrodipicolinate reductase
MDSSAGEKTMSDQANILIYGIGPIGQGVARAAINRIGIKLIGAYDKDPAKIGRDLGELCGMGSIGIKVTDKLHKVISLCNLVILTTGSSLQEVYPQLAEVLKSGKPVVSTCEELSFPWGANRDFARKIDELACKEGVAVLATGVNPGFLMDALPIFLTTVCLTVKRIKIERHQDAAKRRIPFQQKIGVGTDVRQFRERVSNGSIKHVGFPESIYMIAHRLGWTVEKVEEDISPVIARKNVRTEAFEVEAGQVCGVKQIARAHVGGEERIVLEMRAYLGCENPRDIISVEGLPNVVSVIEGGVNGDIATVAAVINSIPVVLNSRPGLRTPIDIPLTSFYEHLKARDSSEFSLNPVAQ